MTPVCVILQASLHEPCATATPYYPIHLSELNFVFVIQQLPSSSFCFPLGQTSLLVRKKNNRMKVMVSVERTVPDSVTRVDFLTGRIVHVAAFKGSPASFPSLR